MLKVQRAHHHLQEISAHLGPWINGDKHSSWVESDPNQTGKLAVMATVSDQPPVDPLSVMLGECLHNLRSAVDLLAFDLAVAYTKPLPDDIAESSEFPIFGDQDRQGHPGVGNRNFHLRRSKAPKQPAPSSGLHKIRGMHPGAQAIIEGLQPYRRGTDFREDPLWRLHVLDNINKHRLLHVTAAAGFLSLRVEGDSPRELPFLPGVIEGFTGVLLSDQPAQVGRLPGLRPNIREEDVKVYPEASVAVIIDNVVLPGPIFQRPPVIETLTEIYFHIINAVIRPLAPFL
jgi:hypothetical protein